MAGKSGVQVVSPETKQAMRDSIVAGIPILKVAEAFHVNPKTLRTWMNRERWPSPHAQVKLLAQKAAELADSDPRFSHVNPASSASDGAILPRKDALEAKKVQVNSLMEATLAERGTFLSSQVLDLTLDAVRRCDGVFQAPKDARELEILLRAGRLAAGMKDQVGPNTAIQVNAGGNAAWRIQED
jgi:hypothetical protein